jgi:hypothetical protein
MPQQQCPHCGKLGPRWHEQPISEWLTMDDKRWMDKHNPGWDSAAQHPPAWAQPHADGSPCPGPGPKD